MISQNVFIVNYNSLYEILNEIKENLSFKITKFENEDDFRKNKNFDEKKELYKSAEDIKITSELSGTAKWTSETIETRSELFAGDAEQIWISLVD